MALTFAPGRGGRRPFLYVAAGVVISRAVVSDLVSGAAAARLFGILMALTGIGPIVAPPPEP
ncbi:hypothetical protein AB0B45_26750 [Nonomuraea sp. NPDC049152]|uniref:hypothetical protein n=1 Tax=Nonomuraea sp. NPDC049152 TaxID=3154350 RepID=UPI0033FA513C